MIKIEIDEDIADIEFEGRCDIILAEICIVVTEMADKIAKKSNQSPQSVLTSVCEALTLAIEKLDKDGEL